MLCSLQSRSLQQDAIRTLKKNTTPTKTPPPPQQTTLPAPKPNKDWVTFQNKTHSYSIQFPPEFTASKTQGDGVVDIHRKTEDGTSATHGRVIISAETGLAQPKTLEEFYQAIDAKVAPSKERPAYQKTTIGNYQSYGYGNSKGTTTPGFTYYVFRPNKSILKVEMTIKAPTTDTVLQSIVESLK